MVPNCVPKESTNEKFDVKYAKSKRGPISVRSFDSANDAKKFLDSMKKQGFNGIISKKGQPVSMQRMKDMQKEGVDEAMSLADIRRKKEREERRERDGKKRYDPLGDIRRKKEREDRNKRDHGGETRSQRMNRKVYGNMMGGLKKEDVNEAVDFFKVAKAFDDYAKKHGGIDKKDFMKVGAFVRQLGRESDVNKQDKVFMDMKKFIRRMDTDPRDGVVQIFQKHGMWKNDRGVGRIVREGLEEKAVSKAQQKFFGMVRAKQKGEMDDASPEVAKAAKSMSKKDVKDFAKTKHKNLPDKVDESTKLVEFSDAQLQQLKKAYADLEKINVTSPTYKKLKAMIARMDKAALEKVARAKVRFVSQIAARELAAKGVKLKASEYMESK